mgnify:CR=1 FL=1
MVKKRPVLCSSLYIKKSQRISGYENRKSCIEGLMNPLRIVYRVQEPINQKVIINCLSDMNFGVETEIDASEIGFRSRMEDKLFGTIQPEEQNILEALPNIHLLLSPFYALLLIMVCVLVVDVLAFLRQVTPVGIYTILGDLGPTLTIIAAIIYVWKVVKSKNESV